MKNILTRRIFVWNGREIQYDWIRKKVKNINLRVRADGTVFVSSPRTVSETELERFLTEKANFLFRALEKTRQRKESLPPPITFSEGDVIYIFGEEKTLRFSSDAPSFPEEKDGVLVLSAEKDSAKIKQQLQKYAEKQFRTLTVSLCEKTYPLLGRKRPFPKIRFRAMRATWGNCRPKENILTFNTRLACYPIPCIEYIVMHEFAHFLVPNHSAAFYAVLSEKMPDWKARKALLNTVQIQPFF